MFGTGSRYLGLEGPGGNLQEKPLLLAGVIVWGFESSMASAWQLYLKEESWTAA